ncbi:hypothetical protein ACWG5P_05795 [Streptomyces prasinus]
MEEMMTGDRFFGVGCLTPKVKDAKDANDWKKRVVYTFEAIPSVHNFALTEIDDLDFYWEGKIGQSGDEEIPLPELGLMTFDVNIPSRIQKQLGILPGIGDVEEFKVLTFFHYVHPITYIECKSPQGGEVSNPSSAMAIVRDFLVAELKKQQSDIELFMIGPSPFHADFSLRAGKGEMEVGDGFSVTVEKGLGYDNITYFHDPSHASISRAVLWQLYSAIQGEFSYFYRFQSLRNARLHAASNLSTQSEELAKLFKKRGFSSYLTRTATVRHKLQSAQLDAISARMAAMQHSRSTKEDMEGLYPKEGGSALKGYLERVTEEVYLEELEGAEKILEVLESRHSQEVQRFATITFSLLGVIVGAVLTAAFRSWWG